MRQIQRQQLQQKLSPQQIQLMHLLQLPVTELEQAIKEEIEKNPLLDAEMPEEEPLPAVEATASDWDSDPDDDDAFDFDYRERLEHDPNAERHEFVVGDSRTFADRLADQLAMHQLTERQMRIADELIGSLDDAGYLGRDLDLIANDLAFRQGIEATPQEVEAVLHEVQALDPPGIGARTLRECLLLQLRRMADEGATDPALKVATEVVEHHFDDFAAHRSERITAAMGISGQTLDDATALIRRLNPKPGSSDSESDSAATYITPDIILTQNDGQLQFHVNDGTLPRLSLNPYYTDMLHEMEQAKGDKQTIQFLRTKQNAAQEFIDLLQQRHDTIVRIMRYIVSHQRRFLLSGDPDSLQPLRQREVAEATGLDISTVSRMANSKYVQTDFGTIPLKDCFSKGMATENGEVSVETIKQRLADAIEAEDKREPLSDDALAKMLNAQGLPLARRTVAKYREQLGLPVARLRRTLVLLLAMVLSTGLQAQMSYYDSIINLRLEAAARQTAQKEQPAKAADTKQKARENQNNKSNRNSQSNRDNRNTPTPAVAPSPTPLEAYIVPLWYDAFPQHRVNPMGRTKIDQLPDEVNLRLVADSADFCFPVRNRKTSNYGWRWNRGHHGVDIALRTGDPVHAAFGGTVRVASRMGGYGNCIVIRHPNGLETLYGHLSKINVQPNQQVAAGEVIGLGGSTGNSTGPHLHFECRFLYQTFDPEWILDFNNYTLRTRRLHLDKSYFGIRQPRKGEQLDYKADNSIIKEQLKKTRSTRTLSDKDF